MLHHQNTIIMKKLFFLSALLLMSVVVSLVADVCCDFCTAGPVERRSRGIP